MMALHHKHIILIISTLLLFICIISFGTCYGKRQEGKIESVSVDDDSAYIGDGYSWKFKGLFRKSKEEEEDDDDDDGVSLKRFDEKFGDPSSSLKIVNVNDYRSGGVGGGVCGGGGGSTCYDDTQAFEKAWEIACSSGDMILMVPVGNYLLKPIKFSGPCKSYIQIQIYGTLDASDDPLDYSRDSRHWLVFDSVKKLSIYGGGGTGTINGNGDIWWDNSCKRDKTLPCKEAPTALTFIHCQNLIVEDLRIVNAQQIHISFQDSNYIKVFGLSITAPGNSPNTDGIHITNTQNVQIYNSVIGTGDDCISIVSGSQNILATNITCGPGHGISIGSLGAGNSKATVSGITVKGAKLFDTTNGVRIKTWQGGSGHASNIQFMNIQMENVTNPIIIDQNYCDQPQPCTKQKSAVQISNILYQGITGTSASDVAVKFDCSDSFPCKDIELEDIYLQSIQGGDVDASCNNAKLSYFGDVNPSCCLS